MALGQPCSYQSKMKQISPRSPRENTWQKENMATSDTVEIVRVPTLVRYLRMDVLEELSFKLNPRHNMKDFRYLAGLMNYNYGMVKNLERQKNPTTYLLSEWDMSHAANGEAKTVGDLIELLKQMKRDDAVEILRPFEFTGKVRRGCENFFERCWMWGNVCFWNSLIIQCDECVISVRKY